MPDMSKFEREIDEILEKAKEDAGPSNDRERPAGKHRAFEPFSTTVAKTKRSKPKKTIRFNPGNLIIGGLLLIAVAAFLPAATLPLAILGVALLVIGYMLWFRKGSPRTGSSGSGMFGRGRSSEKTKASEPEVKYWRGRRIEEKPSRRDQGKIIDFGSPDDDDKK
ncbi:MAG: hypothetical protein HOE43_07720 [Chloroflexi bacterium]|jgi:hypothetical protein|nr:hypothetical protein [Chloroflexota bacterium]